MFRGHGINIMLCIFKGAVCYNHNVVAGKAPPIYIAAQHDTVQNRDYPIYITVQYSTAPRPCTVLSIASHNIVAAQYYYNSNLGNCGDNVIDNTGKDVGNKNQSQLVSCKRIIFFGLSFSFKNGSGFSALAPQR